VEGEFFFEEDVTRVCDVIELDLLYGIVLLDVVCAPIQMLAVGLDLPLDFLHWLFVVTIFQHTWI
jgi:hypothetical protein